MRGSVSSTGSSPTLGSPKPTESSIDLSIVIPSYETADRLMDCLDSLLAAREAHPELRFEVIVVDNGSRDASVTRVRDSALRPRLIACVRNRGFAAAVNAGLRVRCGRHVLLLNSDVVIEPNLLSEAVRMLDAHPDLGVLGPALFHSDGRAQRSVHPLPRLRTELLPEWLPRALRPRGFLDAGPRREVSAAVAALRDVEAIRGAVFFVRGDWLESVGFFDEGYFFFLEETDYCARVRDQGGRVVLAPGLRAEHGLGASSKRRSPLATRIEYHRSLYRFLTRWRGPNPARVVRCWRGLRNLASLILLSRRRRRKWKWSLHLLVGRVTRDLKAATASSFARKGTWSSFRRNGLMAVTSRNQPP